MPHEPSISEVIGRMIMVGIRGASLDDPATREDLDACKTAHVGGVILFDVDMPEYSRLTAGGTPKPTARDLAPRNILSTTQVQRLIFDLRSGISNHILVAIDQEGGQVTRISRILRERSEPGFVAASLLQHVSLATSVHRMTSIIASLGFNVNFAPCVDVAVNPDNPIVVVNGRCISADPNLVIKSAREWARISANLGVTPCLKHFPGHGSSTSDTHAGFVDITSSFRPEIELAPYRTLISDDDLPPTMVMTGHLFDAAVDPEHPASLSAAHTTGLLRETLGFKGVVVTDSLDMGAITQRYSVEEACILAINAGADILLDANNSPGPPRACPAPLMHEAIMRALSLGRIAGGEDRLRQSWRRIEAMRSAFRPAENRA